MTTEFRLPELGENVATGAVTKILVAVGDAVASGQNVLEIETDKAVAEIPCPLSGKIVEIRVREGQKISPGEVILVVEESAASGEDKSAEVEKVAVESDTADAVPRKKAKIAEPLTEKMRRDVARAAPSVRQLAREHGIVLEEVPTADPTGKITAQDVLKYAAARKENAPLSESADETVTADSNLRQDSDKWGKVTIEPMNAVRSKAAAHLTHCWTTIPHVTHFDKADITELDKFRKHYARQAEAAGAHLTVTAFLIKLLPDVFKRFPRMNATVDMDRQLFVLKQYCNIGVAVDTPNGLIVPVIRHVDKKNVMNIAIEMADSASRARERKLALEDMQGGGFTVSNLGGMGGYAFTPIINAPETAILGVSRAGMEPVYNGKDFEPRLMLPLSLSYDHRCIDGADAARFLRYLCESLEHPWRLTLGL
ncbi:MAG TPA: biotin/lipoyl-binding protein [Candidatus Hydrogenedentes bacterium]|nr:biotin/lipoyl-binding protein [Candidatus Hydrogenedentota bacterium]